MLKPSNVNPFFVDKPPFFWDWITTKSFWSVKSAWHPYIPLMHPFWMLVKSPFLVAKKQQHPSQIRFFGGKNQNFPLHSFQYCSLPKLPLPRCKQIPSGVAACSPTPSQKKGLNPIESHQNLPNKYLQGSTWFHHSPAWWAPPVFQIAWYTDIPH